MSKKRSSAAEFPVADSDMPYLVDTHCHLDFPDYHNDLIEVLRRSCRAGVGQLIGVGIDIETSRRAVTLARTHSGVYATVGVHPHHVNEVKPDDYRLLRELAAEKEVVAYGEIGLDYAKEYSPAPMQREHFALQVEMAKELELPLVIHDREAHVDTLAVLRNASPLPQSGVMHCFSGNAAFAEEVMALGFYISIPGVVTFKSAVDLAEAVRAVPLERMLLETDAPFLAPAPWRGRRNEPAFVYYTARKIAELKGCGLHEVARRTTANACDLFKLSHRLVDDYGERGMSGSALSSGGADQAVAAMAAGSPAEGS